jgi:carbonic anhydrase
MKSLIICILIILVSSYKLNCEDKINCSKALDMLKAGNLRFSISNPAHPNISKERLKETTEKNQHPFATILSCSDSRVPVEIIFDQGIGDIFTVKVAGNVMDTDEIGSVEYGIDHLKTPVLIVLGHTNCGAVTAVCTNEAVHGSITQLVDNIIPTLEKVKSGNPNISGKELIPFAIEANVFQSIEDLLKRSEDARNLVNSGELIIIGAVYDIENGSIKWLGAHPKQVELINSPLVEITHVPSKPIVKSEEVIDNPNVNLKFGIFLAIAFLILAIPVTLITMVLFDWVRKKL